MPKTTALQVYKDRAAIARLQKIRRAGAVTVAVRISHHGSDCSVDAHARRWGRCVRAARLCLPAVRGRAEQHWLLVAGDAAESRTVRLSGPYRPSASLFYGGGFWEKVLL